MVGMPGGTTGLGSNEWSALDERSVETGATIRFHSFGTPNGLGMVLSGTPATNTLDLGAVGGTPGCWIHLSSILSSKVEVFGAPVVSAYPKWGGLAVVPLQLPHDQSIVGTTLATQWADLSQNLATSAARTWTVSAPTRVHDVAIVYSEFGQGPTPASGSVLYGLFSVLGFEIQ